MNLSRSTLALLAPEFVVSHAIHCTSSAKLFTDDLSRYDYVFLIRHKPESLERFKELQNEVDNQFGKKIKTLRSDRGGEYLSIKFNDHLK
jgi:hypothetical protein